MSMREKSLERRRVTKEHNSNFRAGHVFVNEGQLYKTGLRGRKRFVFYLILLVLYVIVLTNLLVLLLIVFSLKINDEGMSLMEVVPGRATRFLLQMYTNKITLNGTANGQLASFKTKNIDFFGEKIDLQTNHWTNAHIGIGLKRTEIYSNAFEVVNPATNKTIFPPQNIQLANVNKVSFGLLNTSRVSSATGKNLHVSSSGNASVSAGEDINLRSNQMQWASATSLRLIANNINLKSAGGLFLGNLATDKDAANTSLITQLCISAQSGRLFAADYNTPCTDSEVGN